MYSRNNKKQAQRKLRVRTTWSIRKPTTIKIHDKYKKRIFTLVNIYVPKIGAPKYMKQILTDIKGERGGNTIIVGDFNTLLT